MDKNGDGDLTDMMEFLGAEADMAGKDGFSEMQAYDLDKNGSIDINEMQNASANNVNGGELMVMVTKINADGTKTQEAKSVTEAFGENSDLTISAQKDAITKNNVGPVGFNDKQYNNQMLGSFDVNLNGQKLSGYQTRDDVNYLNNYYNFVSGSATGAGARAKSNQVSCQNKLTNVLSSMYQKNGVEMGAFYKKQTEELKNSAKIQIDAIAKGAAASTRDEDQVQTNKEAKKEQANKTENKNTKKITKKDEVKALK